MEIHSTRKKEFIITTDKSKLDEAFIHRYLDQESYWARNITLETVMKSIQGSECFGVYHHEEQIGFARVITDQATFGYLADVFIVEKYRRRGLGLWLIQTILCHPGLQGFRRWMLATRDAHGLYSKVGFRALDNPERIMRFSPFEDYPSPVTSPAGADPAGEGH